MLAEDSSSRMYKRIFAEFNTSLFGTAPSLSNDFVADDGDYDSEVERFKRDTREITSAEDATDVGTDETSPEFPSSPAAPHQLDRQVSVSVTSRVSHTVATSESQVSNVVTSNISLSTEREARESPPPIQVTVRPGPTKKVPAKSSTNGVRTRSKKSNQDVAPAEPPTRALRNRP